jgi:hypothetical protein
MKRRSLLLATPAFMLTPRVTLAHHGWSSFDETRPIYLEGKVTKVKWQNPHAEIVMEINHRAMPATVAQLDSPKQQAAIDPKVVIPKAVAPTRKDKNWEVEFAPIFRMEAWKMTAPKEGDNVAVIGYTFKDEKGSATLRVEYWLVGGKAVPLRSMPA